MYFYFSIIQTRCPLDSYTSWTIFVIQFFPPNSIADTESFYPKRLLNSAATNTNISNIIFLLTKTTFKVVIELLRDNAAQTQKLNSILTPHYVRVTLSIFW